MMPFDEVKCAPKLIPVKMFRESFFGLLTENIEQNPRFQEAVTVRKHLNVGGNHRK